IGVRAAEGVAHLRDVPPLRYFRSQTWHENVKSREMGGRHPAKRKRDAHDVLAPLGLPVSRFPPWRFPFPALRFRHRAAHSVVVFELAFRRGINRATSRKLSAGISV